MSPPRDEPPQGDARSEKKLFLDHLEDLRWTILKILAAVLVAFIVSFVFHRTLLHVLQRPLQRLYAQLNLDEPVRLAVQGPAEGIGVIVKTALLGAVILSVPFWFYFLMGFLMPALTRRERGYVIPTVAGGTLLFAAGCAFCYFLILPPMLRLFWGWFASLGLENVWFIDRYLSFAVTLIAAVGLCFELPLVLLLLVALGVISIDTLKSKRRYAIVLCFIAGALVSPPDPGSQIMVALPMVLLYEGSIWTAVLIMGRRRRRANDAATEFGEAGFGK